MRPFDFYSPSNQAEALALLREHKDDSAVVAGGTDIVLELHERKIAPIAVIDISRLKELDYIKDAEGQLRIGALTTFTSLAKDICLKENVRILHLAAEKMGSPQIRNLATIGGNIVTSSVAGDGLAACLALDADVTLESARGRRVMKLESFLNGEGAQKRNALEADELLTEISFPKPGRNTATSFYKLAKRKSLGISVIGGCLVVSADEKGICTRVSMRAGALGRYPMRFESAEKHLLGKKLSAAVFCETLPMMHDQVLEVNKSRPWSVYYKKESVKGVFSKLFRDVLSQLDLEERT